MIYMQRLLIYYKKNTILRKHQNQRKFNEKVRNKYQDTIEILDRELFGPTKTRSGNKTQNIQIYISHLGEI